MKIALVTPYSMHKAGGVAEHVAHLRDEFRGLGHTVKVMAPRGPKGGLEVGEDYYGIGRTITIPGNGSKMRLTFDVTLYADVKRIMKMEQFDVVHCHEPLAPVLPYMVLLNSSAVNVATFHAYAEQQYWYSAFKPYMSFVLGRVDSRIAVSEPARELVSKYFEGEYRIIPNGIDVAAYGPHVEKFPWANDGVKRILFVGRYEESRKGFRYLLRAFPYVKQQYPNARLIVVGGGRPEKFEGLIERLGITDIEFKGFVSAEDKARYYASCDVMAVPSTGGCRQAGGRHRHRRLPERHDQRCQRRHGGTARSDGPGPWARARAFRYRPAGSNRRAGTCRRPAILLGSRGRKRAG